MNNLDIRIIVSEHHLKYKDIAKEMNITPEWLSKLLSNNLTSENRKRILQAAERLKGAVKDGER